MAWKYLKWQGRCKNKEITYLIGCAAGFFCKSCFGIVFGAIIKLMFSIAF